MPINKNKKQGFSFLVFIFSALILRVSLRPISQKNLVKLFGYGSEVSGLIGAVKKLDPLLKEGGHIEEVQSELDGAIKRANELLAKIRGVYPGSELPLRLIVLFNKFDQTARSIREALNEAKHEVQEDDHDFLKFK